MAKIIEFIAPVDAMRGNLSGRQSLTYGEGKTSAYDTQVGSVTAANNYTPRFVGAKRSRDEKKYFQVRTTSSVGLTAISKKSMAVLAGASLCFLAANKNLMIISILQSAFKAAKEADQSITYRKWLMGIFYPMLANKLETVTITSAVGNATINNPWVLGGVGDYDLTIASKDLIKFASVLADPQPIPVILGAFGRVFVRWNNGNPQYKHSLEWNTKDIPEGFNPDFQGPTTGHHFILQPELMEGYMMLQEKNGNTLVASWKIMDGETPVGTSDNVIAGHDYALEPIS